MSEEELMLRTLGDALNRALVGGASYSGVALDGAKIHLRIEDDSSRQPETRLWSVQTDFWVELEHIAEIAALAILAADAADVRLEVTNLYDGSPAADAALDQAEIELATQSHAILEVLKACAVHKPRTFDAFWMDDLDRYHSDVCTGLYSHDGVEWFDFHNDNIVMSSHFTVRFHGGNLDGETR